MATRFRQWATTRLREFIQEGFVLDDDRLRGNRSRYFRELLQRIRDIRSSERNLYQQVTVVVLLKKVLQDFVWAMPQLKLETPPLPLPLMGGEWAHAIPFTEGTP